MKESFRVYSPTISVNSFYTGNRQYKSAAAREWSINFIYQLNQPQILKKLQHLRESFNVAKQGYKISFEFAYPKEKLFTKSGGISSKTIDISNSEKHVLDILMLPKFYSEIANLNVDDKHVIEMNSKKIISENDAFYINVTIEIISLNNLG